MDAQRPTSRRLLARHGGEAEGEGGLGREGGDSTGLCLASPVVVLNNGPPPSVGAS